MLQNMVRAEILLCWVVWVSAFLQARIRAKGQIQRVSSKSSKYGIAFVGLSFALISADVHPMGFEKSVPSLVFAMVAGPAAVILVWASVRHLGKQWRFVAALSEDHELIQSGPYRWVRHPIYASMLAMLFATGSAWTWWPMFLASIAAFLVGTEIRVQAEDQLLEERFQDSFRLYRSNVRAYVPRIR